jgi:hypothetical protein
MNFFHLRASALALLTASALISCSSDETTAPEPSGGAGGTAGSGAGGSPAGSAGASGAGSGGTSGGSGGSAGSADAGAGGSVGGAGSGGSAGSAGGSDAGGTGGSGGGGGCGSALICDDFEDDTVGQDPGAPWTKNVDDHGGVVITSETAFSGEKSVKVTLDGNPGYKRAYFVTQGAPLFPAAKDMLWGRMMLKTDAAPNDGMHWTNIEGQGPVPGENYRALIRYGGQQVGRLMANYETSGVASDCWHHSQQAMPTGVWACMEWQFDAATDTMRFYLNGAEVSDLTVQNANDPPGNGDGCISNGTNGKWNFPEFDKVSLGLELYQNDPARTVYIDDVALGTERIGCPAVAPKPSD